MVEENDQPDQEREFERDRVRKLHNKRVDENDENCVPCN